MASSIMSTVSEEERVDFKIADQFRNVAMRCPLYNKDLATFYVSEDYLCAWSQVFNKACKSAQKQIFSRAQSGGKRGSTSGGVDLTSPGGHHQDGQLDVDLTDFMTAHAKESLREGDVSLFLEVIYGHRILRSLDNLLPLMRVGSALESAPVTQAICIICVLKIRSLKEADLECRKRLLPLLFKTLSWYEGDYLAGMWPAILAPCTRSDIETIILHKDLDVPRGGNPELAWAIMEHYLRATQVSQNRAMELLGRQWEYETLNRLFKDTDLTDPAGLTEDICERFGLDFQLILSDGLALPVSKVALLAVSSVFRSLVHWDGGEETLGESVELPDDSVEDWTPGVSQMLSATVYGCLWRISGIDDFVRSHYLKRVSTEQSVRLFRMADKYNIIALIQFFAEVLMMDDSISLMDKVVLADGCYRVQFLDMCFQNTAELAKLVNDPEHDADWKLISPKTKDRLLHKFAESVIYSQKPPNPIPPYVYHHSPNCANGAQRSGPGAGGSGDDGGSAQEGGEGEAPGPSRRSHRHTGSCARARRFFPPVLIHGQRNHRIVLCRNSAGVGGARSRSCAVHGLGEDPQARAVNGAQEQEAGEIGAQMEGLNLDGANQGRERNNHHVIIDQEDQPEADRGMIPAHQPRDSVDDNSILVNLQHDPDDSD